MACLLFYRRGYKKWQGFKILSPLYFCTFLSLQPSYAQKFAVLLIFVRPMEQTLKKNGGRKGRDALHRMVNQHLIFSQ